MPGIAEVRAGFGGAAIKGGDISCSHPREFQEDRAEELRSPVVGELKGNTKTAPCSLSWTIGATQLVPIYFSQRNGEERRPLSDIHIPG